MMEGPAFRMQLRGFRVLKRKSTFPVARGQLGQLGVVLRPPSTLTFRASET
jgi:hypothetical protein